MGITSPAVQQFYGAKMLLEMLSFTQWVSRLEASDVAENNPGVKLMDVYQRFSQTGSFKFCTERAQRQSPTMRGIEAISPKLMIKWLTEWEF